MENSVLPKDLYNIIFKFCNPKTLFNLKKLCKQTNKMFTIVITDPINDEYEKCGVVIYEGNHMKKKIILKDKGTETKLKKIVRAYKNIIQEYSIDADKEVLFTIKWNGTQYLKYKCQTVNEKISILIVHKNKTVSWPIEQDLIPVKHYQLYYKEDWIGTFTGTTPHQAASKAFTGLMKRSNESGKALLCDVLINFTIKEKTRESSCKYYYYTGIKKKLDVPEIVTIGNGNNSKNIQYNYMNKINRRSFQYKVIYNE